MADSPSVETIRPLPIEPVIIMNGDRENGPENGYVNPLAPQTHLPPRRTNINAEETAADNPATEPSPTVREPLLENSDTPRNYGSAGMDDAVIGPGGSAASRDSCSRRICGGHTNAGCSSDTDTGDDAPLLYSSSSSSDGHSTRIEMPDEEDNKPNSPHDRFPKEYHKGLLSVAMMFFAAVLNEVVLSFVHERVPETPPLPDITFRLIPYYPKGLEICEYIMLTFFGSTLVLIAFHRHRWIIARRLFVIGTLLYLMRCVTMMVTQVPVADQNFYCSPKLGKNATFWNVLLRGLKSLSAGGLNVQGKNTLCGDYIYSGHTIVLVISALFMSEYSPKRWWWLRWLGWITALVGVIFLVISRGHYTLDVILSYFVCTRVFWSYHTMAALPHLRSSPHNHHGKEYWYYVFTYMECKTQRPIPYRFEFPIPVRGMRSALRWRQSNSRIE